MKDTARLLWLLSRPTKHLPADHKAAIRQMKQALRARIGDVQAVFDKLSARISERLQEIETLKAAGQEVWPTIPFRDIAEGNSER